MGNPIHFATCRDTCRVRDISIFLYEELFKFRKKFLNPCIPNFDMCKIEKNLRPKSGPPPSPLKQCPKVLKYFGFFSKILTYHPPTNIHGVGTKSTAPLNLNKVVTIRRSYSTRNLQKLTFREVNPRECTNQPFEKVCAGKIIFQIEIPFAKDPRGSQSVRKFIGTKVYN